MAEITVETVNAKLEKGEKLTSEETQFVMSLPPENASAGNKAAVAKEEEIIWPEEAEGEKTPEGKETEEKVAADKKKTELSERAKKVNLPETATEEEIIAAEKKPATEDPKLDIERLETELAKPEGQENLEGLTKREAAYFWQMRRDRRARQKAEEDRDAVLFREMQRKNEEEASKKPKEEAVEDPLAELKKRDQDDFMTVSDVVATLEKALKATKAPAKKEAEAPTVNPVQLKYLELCDNEARINHPEDYDAVMELAPEIVNTNESYVKEVIKAIANKENPAERTYQLIKSDPEFSKLFPAVKIKVEARKAAQKKPEAKTPAEIQKEKEAQAAQEALEKNKDKTKTTGHAGGEGGGAEDTGKIDGYSIEDIFNMSDMQFARLPKKTREKFLQKYG